MTKLTIELSSGSMFKLKVLLREKGFDDKKYAGIIIENLIADSYRNLQHYNPKFIAECKK